MKAKCFVFKSTWKQRDVLKNKFKTGNFRQQESSKTKEIEKENSKISQKARRSMLQILVELKAQQIKDDGAMEKELENH